jgi:membrane protease YdiL (CAAX protease family)
VGADAEFGVDLRSKSAFLDPVTPRERRAPIRFALVLVFLVLLPAQITGALGAALAAAIDFAFNAPEKGYLHLFETRLVSPAVNYNDDLGQLAEALPNLFNNGVVAGLLLLFASRRAARRPLTFFTSQKRFRWRLFWTAMATTTAVYLAGMALSAYVSFGHYEPGTGWMDGGVWRAVAFLACMPLLIAVLASSEEVIFRGWGLQQTAAFTRWTPALLGVSTTAFVFFHGNVFDHENAFDWARPLQLAIAGAAFAWAALRTGGLEASCGAHIAMNLAYTFFDRDRSMATILDAAGEIVSVEVGSARPTTVEWVAWWIMAASPAVIAEALVRTRLRPRPSGMERPA